MPEITLTGAAWAQVLRESPNDPFLWLVEITHEQLADPLRMTSNAEPIRSRDRLFWPVRLATALPERTEDAPPRSRLIVEDVPEDLRREIRALRPHRAPRVSVELVLRSDPDTTQRRFRNFRIFEVAFGAVAVDAELRASSKLLRAAPWAQFTPDLAPGVHRYVGAAS